MAAQQHPAAAAAAAAPTQPLPAPSPTCVVLSFFLGPAPAVIVYFTAGLTYSAGAFFMYWAQLVLAGLVFGLLFILLAA